MKVFIFMLFFNPDQGIHFHEGFYPLSFNESMEKCKVRATVMQEQYKTKILEDFVVDCVEAKDPQEALKKIKQSIPNV
ncbi:MAG: hypothetical protein JKY50_00040 [Oleispira sp.]|nr:hypothetical protein [Oleispira sp.]